MKEALTQHFLDQFSLGLLFLLTVASMALFIEIGFRLGAIKQAKPVKAQTAQVRAIMGATLGLVAFMLAFTFATGQAHYEVAWHKREFNIGGEWRGQGTCF